jgi:hypothetical protein
MLLDELALMTGKLPKDQIYYKNYHLEARLVRETSKNKEEETKLLKKSLEYLGEQESISRALILHELALLTEENNGLYNESNKIFYNLIGEEHKGFNIIKYCIPDPRY